MKGQSMSDIKILVATHKEFYRPENPLIFQVQVGSALADHHIEGILHDDEGENISKKNRSYCELTAQYWAWKNLQADYYGFFHYRRYMSFKQNFPVINGKIQLKRWTPYLEADSLEGDLSPYDLDEMHMRHVIEQYDVITVLSERMDVTAYEQFGQFHRIGDLDRAIAILKEMYPEQAAACDAYMQSKYIYICNMYIMKREYFHAYMNWLFPVLEKFESQTDFSGYSDKEMRVTGYIAERLFGVYYTWLKQQGSAKCAEVPYVIFHQNVREFQLGKKGPRIKVDMRKVNQLIPAGTMRRRMVRRLLRKEL